MYEYNFAPQGWQCPICKRVYAPTYPWCIFCGNEQTVTTDHIDVEDVHEVPYFKQWQKDVMAATSSAYVPKPNETITAF